MTGKFNIFGQYYYQDAYIKPDAKTNAYTVINRGTGIVTINGIPLSPPAVVGQAGDSITIGGHIGEVFGGNLELKFTPGTATPQAVVIQKFYLES